MSFFRLVLIKVSRLIRKINDPRPALEAVSGMLLQAAKSVRAQRRHQWAPKKVALNLDVSSKNLIDGCWRKTLIAMDAKT
jgi:hypothetical protein